ncbi:MAG: hypothetical protein DWQ02_19715 [Bacteroidetes bacterium]|nr:MAG: hypothetical protein DWQ02_19715 [Bacteroidota bacterium]
MALVLIPALGWANAAQPGLRMAGGMGGFTLLFPEDSASYQIIQMQEEQVSIQLYPGFAVVKGSYWMQNTTPDTLNMRTGYPVNAHFSTTRNSSELAEIYFDELYKLKVLINGEPVTFEKKAFEADDPNIHFYAHDQPPAWYIWTMAFPPGITLIEVYFIVNTNESTVSEGYNRENPNGFIYVLETGSSWKPPIGKGFVSVQLMDGLSVDKIKGVSPDSIFKYSTAPDFLFYQFSNLVPDHEDNLVITYGNKLPDFNFEQIIAQAETYFSRVDGFAYLSEDPNGELIVFPSPFDVSGGGNFMVGVIMFVALYGLPILGTLFLILFVLWFIRRRKNKKKG